MRVYVGLGSNLRHPRRQLARAVRALAGLPRTRVVGVSGNYVSDPLDCPGPQPDFVNAVAALETALPPLALLAQLRAIERRQRREPQRQKNASRTLDLDLLLYGRARLRHPRLVVPHPRMDARAFVLRPLTELSPRVTIPGRGLASSFLPAVRAQRIEPTRTHRTHRPLRLSSPWTSTSSATLS
ncbi:MAG: 2-amino-4-hydroxy-6-hydroxymethyldihydropteridine diphosphokinase [Casimicrobiaceae bacterium]